MPKDPKLRQRTNKSATRAILSLSPPVDIKAPPLPKRNEGVPPWHKRTLAFWRDIWQSPMAPEFLKADQHMLYVLAELMDQFHYSPTVQLAAEIRQQRQCFGLTSLDRRRLEWTIQRVEEGAERKANPPAPSRQRVSGDPRLLLSVVS
jgi:hypothetical protein